jgi:uncharacterized protein involved in exopolysaccharide biosynthesis
LTLIQFLAILLARRWMILTAVLASVLGGIAVVLLVAPRYEANARVILEIIEPDPVTGQVLPNQFVRTYTATQIQLIKDYKVAGAVVDELGWTSNPAMLQQYGSGDLESTRRAMAQRIMSGTEASLIQGSNILEISYTAASPDTAKVVVEAIRKAYADVSLAFKRDTAGRSADWYQEQTENARRLLAFAETEKAKFEREHGVIMQADKSDVDSARLAALANQGEAPVSTPVPMAGGVSATATELARVESQLAQARRTLGGNHPTLIQLEQQRSALAAQVAQERSAVASANSAATAAAGASSGAAGRALAAQRAKVIAKRGDLAKLRQLQDEVDLRREQYQKAAARGAELRLQANVAEAGVTLLGSAVAPEDQVFPNVPLILFGAFAFGTMLGLLSALLTELLNRRVRVARDLVDAAADVPLLAVIGSTEKKAVGVLLRYLPTRLRGRPSSEALAA